MPLSEQAARAARNARVRSALGLAEIPPANWTYEQRNAYNKALASAILTDSDPASADELTRAQNIAGKEYAALENYGLGDAASDFTAEFIAQGQAINPLSAQNRGKTLSVIVTVVSLAAVAYFAVLAWRTSPRNSAAK